MSKNRQPVDRNRGEIEKSFVDCLSRLFNHCIAFDAGYGENASDIANCVYSIVANDSKTKLGYLSSLSRRDNARFLDSTYPRRMGNLLTYAPLAQQVMDVNPSEKDCTTYYRLRGDLHSLNPIQFSWLHFNDWWSGEILWYNGGPAFSRMTVIKYLRNQTGAHASTRIGGLQGISIDELKSLQEGSVPQWGFVKENGNIVPNFGLEYVTVRGIAQELLISMRGAFPNYFEDNITPKRNPKIKIVKL